MQPRVGGRDGPATACQTPANPRRREVSRGLVISRGGPTSQLRMSWQSSTSCIRGYSAASRADDVRTACRRLARCVMTERRSKSVGLDQQWCGAKLPLSLHGAGVLKRSPSTSRLRLASRTHWIRTGNRDQCTRTTYSPGFGRVTVSETGSLVITRPGDEMTGAGFVTA